MHLYSNAVNETVEEPQTWRSLQPGETIDEALEKAKKILENIPLNQPAETFSSIFQPERHQLMASDTENRCTTLVPYESVDTQRQKELHSDEVIILSDSSDYGSPEIPSGRPAGATEMPADNQVVILEDSTADSEVLEVVPQKEELKPVETQINDEDFGNLSMNFNHFQTQFRNNRRKGR